MSEMPTVYEVKRPKARKVHRCCECHGTIQVGEKYHSHWGVWEGDAQTFKVCNDCEDLRGDLNRDVDSEEGVWFAGMEEWVLESGDKAQQLRFAAIRQNRGAPLRPWMQALLKEQGALL